MRPRNRHFGGVCPAAKSSAATAKRMVFIPIAIPFVLGEYIISGRPGMTVPLVPGKALMELSVCIQTF